MSGSEGQIVLPSQFGRYTLIERLAIGGMAEVFRAKIVASHGFEKILVIKRILPHLAADKTFVTMFIDEAKLTAQLTHPKIVQVLDFGDVGGQYFIALEYVDGFDALALLRAAAQKRIRIPLSLAVFIAAEVLDALDYAHNARDMDGRPMHLVHRDISPSNIFISRRGDVKLGDFGIAHADERESKTQAGTLKGKYGYMSPEQVVGGALDGRTDVFAVGIVLAEMFMGRRLFTARNDLDVLLMVRDVRIERLERYAHDLPHELDAIVRRSLRREASHRYQTAAELRDALRDYLFTTGARDGASQLRAFAADLFDDTAAAAERLALEGRRLAEPRAKGVAVGVPGPAAALPLPSSNTEAIPQPLPRQYSDPNNARAGGVDDNSRPWDTSRPWDVSRPAPAPSPPPAPPPRASQPPPPPRPSASPHQRAPAVPDGIAAALAAAELAVVDLDQWGLAGGPVLPAYTGGRPPTTPPRPGTHEPVKGPSFGAASLDSASPTPATSPPEIGAFVSAKPDRPPDSAGDLSLISPMRIFAQLAVAQETGLLRFENAGEVKEVFLVAGSPESVSSSVSGERFGAYLVARGVLRPADLELALATLPRFSGKLGDTLVGLGLMQPLDVFRLLSQQVRDRVIEIFGWTSGTFAFYRRVRNPQESFPLGLDAFEILGAGVLTLATGTVESRFGGVLDSRPVRTARGKISPETFRLGPTPAEVLSLLDGDRSLRAWMSHFTAPDELGTFLRALYLLVETDLAELD